VNTDASTDGRGDLETKVSLEEWELVAGFLLPILIDVIKQRFPRSVQAITSFVVTGLVVLVTLLIKDEFDWENFWPSLLKVFAVNITSYYGLWKPTGISERIEEATTIVPKKE
jgi:hypothetical protein